MSVLSTVIAFLLLHMQSTRKNICLMFFFSQLFLLFSCLFYIRLKEGHEKYELKKVFTLYLVSNKDLLQVQA